MLQRRDFLTAGVAVVVVLFGGTRLVAAAGFASPEDLVKSIYGLYGAATGKPGEKCNHQGNGFPDNAREAGRYFEPALARAYLRTKKLDADPFIMGQDWCVADLVISAGPDDGKKATVTARFKNFDTPSKVGYHLVKAGQG